MPFWNGSAWISEDAPAIPAKSSTARDWAATLLMVVGLSLPALPLGSAMAQSSAGHADPSCTLAALNLGNADVVQITATGLPHNASFVTYWTEPQITATQYYWSTNQGVLQNTVMNEAPGEYSASVYWRSKKGDVWEASCSIDVGY